MPTTRYTAWVGARTATRLHAIAPELVAERCTLVERLHLRQQRPPAVRGLYPKSRQRCPTNGGSGGRDVGTPHCPQIVAKPSTSSQPARRQGVVYDDAHARAFSEREQILNFTTAAELC